jgi:hypothetical protein
MMQSCVYYLLCSSGFTVCALSKYATMYVYISKIFAPGQVVLHNPAFQ